MSKLRFLAFAFAHGCLCVLSSLELVVAFADLLFDFLRYQVYCRVEIAFCILRKQVGPGNAQPNRAAERAFRHFCVIVIQSDASIDSEPVQVRQLLQAIQNVILNRLRQSHVMCRKNEFHEVNDAGRRRKIQSEQALAGKVHPLARFRRAHGCVHDHLRAKAVMETRPARPLIANCVHEFPGLIITERN
jgi:hypothetical protein